MSEKEKSLRERIDKNEYGLVHIIHFLEATYYIFDCYGTITCYKENGESIDLPTKYTYEESIEACINEIPYGQRLLALIKGKLLELMFAQHKTEYWDYDVQKNLMEKACEDLQSDMVKLDRKIFEQAYKLSTEIKNG